MLSPPPGIRFGITLINLDRSADRLERAHGLLDPAGLPWSRLPAAEGDKLEPGEQALIDAAAFARNMGRPFRAGEAGCAFSHLRALSRFLDSERTHELILEDDFTIPADRPIAPRIEAILGAAERWDLLKAYTFRAYAYVPACDLGAAGRIVRPLNRVTKTLGHFVNRRAAEAVLAAFTRFDEPIDWFLDRPWRFKVKYRALRPDLIEEAPQLASTIGYARKDVAHLPLYRRGGALVHRFGMGVRRTLNNLAAP